MLTNRVPHPEAYKGRHLLGQVTALRTVLAKAMRIAHEKGYQHPNPIAGDKWNIAQIVNDPDIAKLLPIFENAMAEPTRHVVFGFKGVELSAAGRPCNKDNKVVNTVEELAATKGDIMVGSKNVLMNLNAEEKEQITELDGMHRYTNATVPPAGARNDLLMPLNREGLEKGVIVHNTKGVETWHTIKPREEHFVFKAIGNITCQIDSVRAAKYNIAAGMYDTGKLMQSTPEESLVTDAGMKGTLPHDFVGKYITDIGAHGTIRPKYDGRFLVIQGGGGWLRATTRDGRRYWLASELDIQCAVELFDYDEFGGEYIILSVTKLHGNRIPSDLNLLDAFREKWKFKIELKSRSGVSKVYNPKTRAPPSDGIIIHTGSEQYYIKDRPTVDIWAAQVPMLDLEFKGKKLGKTGVYECHFKPGILVVRKRRFDRVLPNSADKIVDVVNAITVEQYLRYHDDCCNAREQYDLLKTHYTMEN